MVKLNLSRCKFCQVQVGRMSLMEEENLKKDQNNLPPIGLDL